MLRYDQVAPGTPWAVIELLIDRVEREEDVVAGRILTQALWSRGDIGKDLEDLFEGNVPLLKRMYLAACRSESHTDPHAEIFDLLVSLDSTFVDDWTRWFMAGKTMIHRRDDHRDYSRLWRRADNMDVTRRFIETAYAESRNVLAFEPYLLVLFVRREGTRDLPELESRQDALLDTLIRDRRDDPDFLQFIFEVIGHLTPERRRGRVDTLLKANSDFDLFQSLSLEPHGRMAFGSWVPVLRKQVEYFESLLSLCDSVELLPHRQALEKRIASLRREMTREKRKDFMRDD